MQGEEGEAFLQGFVTADMEEERGEGTAFYSMMLNAQVNGWMEEAEEMESERETEREEI